MRFSALARSAFVTEDDARHIIAALVELDLLEIQDESEARFTAKLVKWSAWEPRDSSGRGRQQRYRNRHMEHDEFEDDDPMAGF